MKKLFKSALSLALVGTTLTTTGVTYLNAESYVEPEQKLYETVVPGYCRNQRGDNSYGYSFYAGSDNGYAYNHTVNCENVSGADGYYGHVTMWLENSWGTNYAEKNRTLYAGEEDITDHYFDKGQEVAAVSRWGSINGHNEDASDYEIFTSIE